jgi:hypothetical protein
MIVYQQQFSACSALSTRQFEGKVEVLPVFEEEPQLCSHAYQRLWRAHKTTLLLRCAVQLEACM